MGKKRQGKGEHLFLYTACFLTIIILAQGCSTILETQESQVNGRLVLADGLLGKGDYAGALKEYEAAFEDLPDSVPGDRALYYMGLTLAHPDNPERDYRRSLACFQRLADDFPDSSLKEEAVVVSGLINALLLRETGTAELEETLNSRDTELSALKETYTGSEEKNKILEDTVRSLKKQVSALKQNDQAIEEKNKMLEETVANLKNQINALKEIDLGIEEKRGK